MTVRNRGEAASARSSWAVLPLALLLGLIVVAEVVRLL